MSWKKRMEEHWFFVIVGVAAASAIAAATFISKLNERDFDELKRYRVLGGTPEQLKGRIDAKEGESCGTRRFWIRTEDYGKPKNFTCGGTTFSYVARRVEKEIDSKCASLRVVFGEGADEEHYPLALQIVGTNERGDRHECAFPLQMENGAEFTDRCECDLLATPPVITVTKERLSFKAMFDPLP